MRQRPCLAPWPSGRSCGGQIAAAERGAFRRVFNKPPDWHPAATAAHTDSAEQNGGGWVQLTFHHICNGCDAYSIPAATMQQLLDWLSTQVISGAVAVETSVPVGDEPGQRVRVAGGHRRAGGQRERHRAALPSLGGAGAVGVVR